MSTNEQVNTIKDTSTCLRNVNILQAKGGFILQAGAQYLDNATNAVVMAENAQGVAADISGAISMASNYLTYGAFDSPQGNLGI